MAPDFVPILPGRSYGQGAAFPSPKVEELAEGIPASVSPMSVGIHILPSLAPPEEHETSRGNGFMNLHLDH